MSSLSTSLDHDHNDPISHPHSSHSPPPIPSRSSLQDPSSSSDISHTRIKHIHLVLEADFQQQKLKGYADYQIYIELEGVKQLKLDTSHLDISSIYLLTDSPSDEKEEILSTQVPYHLISPSPIFGSPLVIELPLSPPSNTNIRLRINYSTTPSSSAIQWLPPEQTAGKFHPYLFTQCQAIHARSFFPCQDTPSNKQTYTAEITVPKPLVALMSAASKGNHSNTSSDSIVYSFVQKVPIPSYLFALAIGALESRKIGPRSHVWSEKETVDAGAYEFEETEQFISTAESIVGPYVWGHYDILVLPPSFPYGGMENPCLTFVTPTLLAGDRSLAGVVAHEISHSWFGNLVTNRDWTHFWANEGFTVFLERKILKSMRGKQVADLDAEVGWRSLVNSVETFGHNHPYTVLNVELDGVDPDDAFSTVPYEKGFNLLFYLETLVGGDTIMNPFLRAYVNKYAYGTITTAEFKTFFLSYMEIHAPTTIQSLNQVDWKSWTHSPGLPPHPVLDTTLITAATTLADKWVASGAENATSSNKSDIEGWETDQTVIFLQQLLEKQKVTSQPQEYASMLVSLDKIYLFSASKNSEIRYVWLSLVIHSELISFYDGVELFLMEQGRMKYIRPLYRDWYRSGPEGKKRATELFKKIGKNYHAIAQKMVAKDLELS